MKRNVAISEATKDTLRKENTKQNKIIAFRPITAASQDSSPKSDLSDISARRK